MKCPRCRTTLQPIEYEGEEIETCPGCQGEWLDDGELKSIVKKVEKVFTAREIAALDAVNKNIFKIKELDADVITCPCCPGTHLRRFNYASSTGILLDKCPECHGIWLDKDELEKVQILVEEWSKKLGEDQKTYGSLLRKTQARCEEELKQAACVSHFGLVNAVLRRFA